MGMELNRDRGKKGIKVLSDFSGIILFVLCIFRGIQITSFLSMIVFIVFIINSVVIEKDRFLLKYIYKTVGILTFILGVFVCDSIPLWLGEIRETTFYSGAFNLIAFYFWLFLTILRLMDYRMSKMIWQKKKCTVRLGSFNLTNFLFRNGRVIIFVFGMCLFASVATHPIFGESFVNRFEYSQQYVSRLLNVVRGYPILLSVLVIAPMVNKDKVTLGEIVKNIIVPYIPYILFLIWTGNKFGAFWELIYYLIIPFLAFTSISRRTIKTIVKYTLIIVIALTALLIGYYILNGMNISLAMYTIGERIACQGELWWKTIAIVDDGSYRIGEMGNEINNIIQSIATEGQSHHYGVYNLMRILGNPAVVTAYESINTRFSASGIELPFYFIRYFSFIVVPLLTCPFLSWFTNEYISAVKDRRFFAAISSAKLLQLTVAAFSQGDFYAFTSTTSILFMMIFIISVLYSRSAVSHRGKLSNSGLEGLKVYGIK